MRIRRLRMVNFRSFRDVEVELDPGLILVVGPNEAGKSTIVEALAVALFTDPASRSRSVSELARWGSSGATRLELGFDHGGSTYRLLKDFGEGRVELEDVTTGRVLGDRNDVDRQVHEMVGFSSMDAFESVAAVRQGELAAIEEKKRARGELVPMIERKMTSSSGVVDAASVLGRLDKEIAAMRAGVDRPAPKNPGPVATCRERIQELEQRVATQRDTWASTVRTMRELAQDREKLEAASTELSKLERAVRGEERSRDLREKLTRIDEALEERESKIGKIRKLRKDIEDAWERIGGTTYGEEKRAIVNAKLDLDAADRRMEEIRESAPGWAAEGSDRRSAVLTAFAGLVAFVLILLAVSGVWNEHFGWLLLLGGAIGATTVVLFRRTMRIWAFARSLKAANTERQRCSHVLMAALSKLGFPNYMEFEHKIEEYDRAQQDAENSRAVLTDICGTDDPKVIEESLEGETASLGRQRLVMEQEIEELGATGMSDGDLAKLKAERDTLQQEIDEISNRITRHEVRLGQSEAEGSLPDLEARLEMAREEETRLVRRLRVMQLARQGLDEALGTTKEAAASALEPIVERILARITLGRYRQVTVEKDLNLAVASATDQPGAPDTVRTEDLSTGTVDQLYLAIRYALLEFLSAHEGAPFILDDALVNSDPDRRSAALRLLHEISDERQVIMLSCENHGQEFADRVIELPAVNGRHEHTLTPFEGQVS